MNFETYIVVVRTFAHYLQSILDDIAKELCYGCQYDRPSQIEHDVHLMMGEEWRIRLCLDGAIKRLDISKVVADLPQTKKFETYFNMIWEKRVWSGDRVWDDDIVEAVIALENDQEWDGSSRDERIRRLEEEEKKRLEEVKTINH